MTFLYSQDPWEKKPPIGVYIAVTFIFFVLTLSAADSVGLVPSYLDEESAVTESIGTVTNPDSLALSDLPTLAENPTTTQTPASQPTSATPVVLPERIIAPAIDLNLPVQNPKTTDVNALDTLLQKGPARYSLSASLGQSGNVVIFAHSSHLPVVHNQMYRAFNRVPELKEGDTITLVGGGKKYLYSVSSVNKADTSDGSIDLTTDGGARLTLVTCDTITGKSARFVLEAHFVGEYSGE